MTTRAEFIDAVKNDHLHTFRTMLERGSSLKMEAGEKESPIHIAARNSSSKILDHIIKQRIEVNKVLNTSGNAPLHDLALSGLNENIKALSKHPNLNPNQESSTGTTALMLAASEGRISTIETLLGIGADINYSSQNGTNALRCAFITGAEEAVKHLLSLGAKTDNNIGDALTSKIPQYALEMLSSGADISSDGADKIIRVANNRLDILRNIPQNEETGIKIEATQMALRQLKIMKQRHINKLDSIHSPATSVINTTASSLANHLTLSSLEI